MAGEAAATAGDGAANAGEAAATAGDGAVTVAGDGAATEGVAAPIVGAAGDDADMGEAAASGGRTPPAAAIACCFCMWTYFCLAMACSKPNTHARYAANRYWTELVVVCVGCDGSIPIGRGSGRGFGSVAGIPLLAKICCQTGCCSGLGDCINWA